jgi:apolipoprotein N-acyltransferase
MGCNLSKGEPVPLDALRVRLPLLLVSAGLLAAAFPTIDWNLFVWIALTPVLACAVTRSPRQALGDGWLMGTVFFVLLLRWLDHTFQQYSAIPWPLTWLPIAALAGYCGLYVGGVACATSWLCRRLGAGWGLLTAPFLWVGGEWVRGHVMSGFPWGLLGYSQYRALPVIQMAEWTGVYGVSFLIVSTNAALVGWFVLPKRTALWGVGAAAGLLGLTLLYGWDRLESERLQTGQRQVLRVSVVQPSIEQGVKWDPEFWNEALSVYRTLTRRTVGFSEVVVWPETATPVVLPREGRLLEELKTLAREINVPLVVGALDLEGGKVPRYFNSAFVLTERGITDKYDKIHLVPFGEYVPLSEIIGFVRRWAEFISDLAAGTEPVVFRDAGPPFGVVICYEGVFPELFRRFVKGGEPKAGREINAGAQWMVNMTNDAWFGRTSGPWQHLAMLPFRAVENRVAIARAANTGVSAFIEPSGRISQTLPLFARGILSDRIPLRGSAETLYTRYGDLFAYACLGVTGVGFAAALCRRSA